MFERKVIGSLCRGMSRYKNDARHGGVSASRVTARESWVVWCGVVWCGVVWCGVVWCGVVWCGVVWCGVMSCLLTVLRDYQSQCK